MKALRIALTLFLIGLVSVVTGCSYKPKPADAEHAFKDRVTKESDGRIRLISFKPRGDIREMVGGGYHCEYEADIEFTGDCVWLYDEPTGTIPIDFRTAASISDTGDRSGKQVQANQRFHITGGLGYDKTKDGSTPNFASIITGTLHPIP